mmetsp:Transcript_34075/g.109660  ORF Transcript_34075/g.109660 Transcript_34075/m.109660 type:complete len:92 (+) Transcript_34075:858-1133(+)
MSLSLSGGPLGREGPSARLVERQLWKRAVDKGYNATAEAWRQEALARCLATEPRCATNRHSCLASGWAADGCAGCLVACEVSQCQCVTHTS